MRRIAVAVVAVALLVAGCGSSESGGTNPAPSASATASSQSASPSDSFAEPASPVIPPKGSPSPDPNFAQGQAVFITSKGFVPAYLIVDVNETLTWINQTQRPVTIQFDNLGPQPALQVPAGAAVGWRPTSWASVSYHDASDPSIKGKVEVEPIK